MGSIMDQERPWDRKTDVEQKDTSPNPTKTVGMFPLRPKATRRFDLEALRKRLGLPQK